MKRISKHSAGSTRQGRGDPSYGSEQSGRSRKRADRSPALPAKAGAKHGRNPLARRYIFRSAITGHFVSKRFAKSYPNITIRQRIRCK